LILSGLLPLAVLSTYREDEFNGMKTVYHYTACSTGHYKAKLSLVEHVVVTDENGIYYTKCGLLVGSLHDGWIWPHEVNTLVRMCGNCMRVSAAARTKEERKYDYEGVRQAR